MTPEAEALQRGFLTRVRLGRPMVTLKLATSLDGRIATSSGESQWITGELARARVHAMRAAHDAILVGAGTARADDPSLTVRGIGIDHQPVRIVAARGLDVPLDGKLAKTSDVLPVWLLHGRSAPETMRAAWVERGAKLLEVDEVDTGLDAAGMLASLGGEGLTRLFCEGGGELAAALLNADLVDELVLFTGGVALGADGRSAVAALGLSALADAPGFRLSSIEAVGSDTMTTWSRHGTA
jgi:diaminohydroxyphosphoribosylaminopyrimidine deaminase/5-amino-6-(5-phosphoribosylamino)uracil reductase